MRQPFNQSSRRFVGVACVAALLASGGCSGDDDSAAADGALETIHQTPGTDPPAFVFPETARSDNESLNTFIREFAQICMAGEYDRYRMTVRRRSDPVSKDAFESVWHNIGEIRIESIVPLPETERDPSPRYAVFAQARSRSGGSDPAKLVVMQVLREGGQWVIDELPGGELDWLRSAATQPAADEETAPTAVNSP